jgi:hypothetical protein
VAAAATQLDERAFSSKFLTVLVDPCRVGFAPPVPESERSGRGNPQEK